MVLSHVGDEMRKSLIELNRIAWGIDGIAPESNVKLAECLVDKYRPLLIESLPDIQMQLTPEELRATQFDIVCITPVLLNTISCASELSQEDDVSAIVALPLPEMSKSLHVLDVFRDKLKNTPAKVMGVMNFISALGTQIKDKNARMLSTL